MKRRDVAFSDLTVLLGPAAARKILEARAGRYLYIPAHLVRGNPLTAILGQPDAQRLVERFGGSAVQVPVLQAKRARIRFLRRKLKWPVSVIAADMRCTMRYVYQVLAAPDDEIEDPAPPSRQLGLPFGS